MMSLCNSLLAKYILIASMILLLMGGLMISTFFLTEHIQGEGHRINLAGRQRMHLFHIANHAHFLTVSKLSSKDIPRHLEEINTEAVEYERVLYGLREGHATDMISSPGIIAGRDDVNRRLADLIRIWEETQKPILRKITEDPRQAAARGEETCLSCHAAFIGTFDQVDDFVYALAGHNELVINQFNLLRYLLLALSVAAAVAIAAFVRHKLIVPARELQAAAMALELGDFSKRLQPRTRDEIGDLTVVFNRMADSLEKNFREMEKQVQERTVELQRSNEELKTFAFTVSHDLRAPLRAMQGFAEAIKEDGVGLGGEVRTYVSQIAAAAEYMEGMIIDLLSYSQISFQEIHLEQVDLNPLLDTVQREMAVMIQEKNGRVTIEGNLPWVRGHYGILKQVVTNLVNNGLKFVSPGTSPRIQIWATMKDEKIRLCCRDNGIGVAPADQQRIFDFFARLHSVDVYPGTGLGLASVRKGMERLSGSCGVESAPGRGSTFWVELPSVTSGGMNSTGTLGT